MERLSSTDKILDTYWNKSEDVFEIKTKFHYIDQEVTNSHRGPTKREIFKTEMAVFDPR